MAIQTTKIENQNWLSIIFDPGSLLIQDISSNWSEYKKIFIDQIAEYLYKDIQRTQHLFTSPFIFKKEFSKLPEEEKLPWYDFASDIPGKLTLLNLYIRPYKDFCRTCLIPYMDLETLARSDHAGYCLKHKSDKSAVGSKGDRYPSLVVFNNLTEKRKRFYIELNHLIPVGLKKIGYEIVRPEEISEINDKMVRKFARAIHSSYLHEIKKQDSGSGKNFYMSWIHNSGDVKDQYVQDFEDQTDDTLVIGIRI